MGKTSDALGAGATMFGFCACGGKNLGGAACEQPEQVRDAVRATSAWVLGETDSSSPSQRGPTSLWCDAFPGPHLLRGARVWKSD